MQVSQSRIDSVAQQLLNHGVGVVGPEAAIKIATAVPATPRIVDGKILVDAISDLAKRGEIELLDVGGHVAIE